MAILYTDGASKGNPGPAGVGVYLKWRTKKGDWQERKYSKPLGNKTNNVAEYEALIYGLEKANQLKIKRIKCFSDSQLMVRQLNGIYRLKNSDVIKNFVKIWNLKISFDEIEFNYIPREENNIADGLAKKASQN
jgi:ribonuclease HI